MTVILRDTTQNNTREFDTRAEAEAQKEQLIDLADADPDSLVIEPSENHDESNGGEPAEVIDSESPSPQPDAGSAGAEKPPTPKPNGGEPVDPETLSKNPISFLRDVNSDFVNVIQGTPAISKRGFRFIQREFEISTESEVVEWSEDPLGCVVWAKAELPSGYSAEAHGEGYKFESGVGDNEFARYADTRAKNRALSDLTSAGALAVSELGVENDE